MNETKLTPPLVVTCCDNGKAREINLIEEIVEGRLKELTVCWKEKQHTIKFELANKPVVKLDSIWDALAVSEDGCFGQNILPPKGFKFVQE